MPFRRSVDRVECPACKEYAAIDREVLSKNTSWVFTTLRMHEGKLEALGFWNVWFECPNCKAYIQLSQSVHGEVVVVEPASTEPEGA